MTTSKFIKFLCVILFVKFVRSLHDLTTCQDDFNLKPPDGILKRNTFNWLGFVQYKHVTNGLQHQSKAPRVILIHKQFVIGTAIDLLQTPKNYKLGNVIFGEYERDEDECGLTQTQLKKGDQCSHAYLETPLLDITPHPEYTRFGVGNSLALAKLLSPMKSSYQLPACLPSTAERSKKKKNKFVFMVDYISNVPQDFDAEKMGKKTLKLYTHRECRRHRMKSKLGSEGVTHVICSSGCGVRPGAPLISHSIDGGFELIGLAAGGAPCSKRSMRRRLIKEPPLYIDVYPYTPWIINVINAHELPLPYPQSFRRTESGTSMLIRKDFLRRRKPQRHTWRGRTYVIGNFCFKSPRKQLKSAFFYSERFEVIADPLAKVTIFVKISAGMECTIVCAKLTLPNRMVRPKVAGVGGYNISVSFGSDWFPYSYFYALALYGKNSSRSDMISWLPERSPGFW